MCNSTGKRSRAGICQEKPFRSYLSTDVAPVTVGTGSKDKHDSRCVDVPIYCWSKYQLGAKQSVLLWDARFVAHHLAGLGKARGVLESALLFFSQQCPTCLCSVSLLLGFCFPNAMLSVSV